MKRTVSAMLAVLVLAAIAACDGSETSNSASSSTSTSTSTSTADVDVAPVTFGPVLLEAARSGLQAHGEGDSQVYFHLGGPAQGYGDGAGGVVYQSLDQWRWSNELDVMWLPLAADAPQTLIAAGNESQALQAVADGQVLTTRVSQDDSNGIVPDERWLVLTDLESGIGRTLMSFAADEDVGIGRASMRDERIVVSLRSLECTWFEFLDRDGSPIEDVRNPRPAEESCSRPLVTGAVLLEDNLIAYVETKPHLEYEFEPDGYFGVVAPFTRAPVQTVVIRSLDNGKTLQRVPVEPRGTIVHWLEPAPGGVVVSLGSFGEDAENLDGARLPTLERAPVLGDIGSDFGMDTGHTFRDGSLLITVADGEPTLREWWFAPTVESIREIGICSARFSKSDMGPPTGVTGLGVDVPITLYDTPPAVDEMRDAIRSAALACDYEGLQDLVTLDRPSPAYFSGPEVDELAEYWRDLENSGEHVLAILAEMLKYQPIGQNPFRWNTNRGDVSYSNATVSINADGEWVGFQAP